MYTFSLNELLLRFIVQREAVEWFQTSAAFVPRRSSKAPVEDCSEESAHQAMGSVQGHNAGKKERFFTLCTEFAPNVVFS